MVAGMETTTMFVNRWARVAKPQSDGYDLHVLSEMDEERFGWVKRQPTTELTMCDGHVGLRTTGLNVFNDTEFRPAQPDEITEPAWGQTEYLNKWTDGYAALTGYLDEYWPHVWLAGSGK